MKQNRKLGLSLMLLALLLWGSLPLQLKILISQIDPVTLTWYRFTGAAVIIALVGGRSSYRNLRGAWSTRVVLLLLLGGTSLVANYLLYLKGLSHLSPVTAQIVMQTVPFMVLAGGILIFRELFGGKQWWGVALLLTGSALFFNQEFGQLRPGSSFLTGIGFTLLSAVAWTTFLLAQKALLKDLSSRTIMFCTYLTGSVLLLTQARTESIFDLAPVYLMLVISATVVAAISYLAFSTAMRHVPATTAGLTIANIPLVTLFFMTIFGGTIEHLAPENLNTLALIGAFLVVVGAALGTLGPEPLTATDQKPQIKDA